jgi:hypothetical protein
MTFRKKKDDYKQVVDEENPYSKKNDDKFTQAEAPKQKFNLFPTKKKRFIREEALALRKCFAMMLPLHVFLLLALDIYIYDIEIMAIIAEVTLIYLDYLNYMNLNKMFMFGQIIIMAMCSFVALTHFERVFLADSFNWLLIISYVLQFFII